MLILYTFFYFSSFFFFLVFDCVVDHAKVSICGKMVVYQIGFFLLKNPYIVPMISQIFLDSWLVSHLPILLWFSCLLESVDNVSQFLVLYFCFQFLHFFFLFQFLVLCFFFQFLDVFLFFSLFPFLCFFFQFLFFCFLFFWVSGLCFYF